MSESVPIRIGHAERAEAVAALDRHLAEGRLDAEEYGERVAQASLARTREELTPLFTDLPAPHPTLTATRSAPRSATGMPHPPSPAWTPPRSTPYDRTGDRDLRVVARDGLRRHPVLGSLAILVVVCAAMPVLLTWLVVAVLVSHGDRRGPHRQGW